MAHVSGVELPKEIRKEIERQLKHILFGNKDGKATLQELLTDTERLMLAKRLAAVLMLIDEHSYYRIQQILGVSVSTCKRLHRLLIGGAFESLEAIARNKKRREEMIRTIETVVRCGLPPYAYVIKKRKKN